MKKKLDTPMVYYSKHFDLIYIATYSQCDIFPWNPDILTCNLEGTMDWDNKKVYDVKPDSDVFLGLL